MSLTLPNEKWVQIVSANMVRNLVKALVVPKFFNRETSIGKETNVATAMERLIIVPERKIEKKSEIFEKNIYLSGDFTLVMTMDNFGSTQWISTASMFFSFKVTYCMSNYLNQMFSKISKNENAWFCLWFFSSQIHD